MTQRKYEREDYPDAVLMWYHPSIKGHFFDGTDISGSGESQNPDTCIEFIFKLLEYKNVIIFQMSDSSQFNGDS